MRIITPIVAVLSNCRAVACWVLAGMGLWLGSSASATDTVAANRPRLTAQLDLNPARVVVVGQFATGEGLQEIKFDQPARGRFFCLESLDAHDGRPYAAVAELNLLDENGEWLDRSNWRIAYVDSEENERENGAAENVLDGNANSFWHTQWGSASPNHPHHLVIDLGHPQTIAGMGYLPRPGTGQEGGRIRDYRVYVGNDLVNELTRKPSIPDRIFLFAYFSGDGSDGLRLADSLNGYHWGLLNHGRIILKPMVGDKLMRDPAIARAPDGIYHLVWTAGWTGNYIGHATSPDLIHWSQQSALPVMASQPGTMNCWAPEMYWDTNRNQCLIFWASSTTHGESTNTEPKNNRIYCTTTSDFKTFTPTRLMYDPGFSVADATLVPHKGRFHLIFKDDVLNRLRMAAADHPEGPYDAPSIPITLESAQGPAVLRLDNQFIAYYHLLSSKNNGAVISSNLEDWKCISAGIFLPPNSEQGTVLELDQEALKPLMDEGYLETDITAESSELEIGSWIWSDHLADRQMCRFWRSFLVPGPVNHAQLKITADNAYTAYLDGEEIGRGGDPNNLTEYDITWQLTPGRHVLAVEAFNDAFDAGLIAGLRMDLASGKKAEIFSDSSWRIVPDNERAWKTQKQPDWTWQYASVAGYAGRMWWQYPPQITRVPPLLPISKHFWQKAWFLVVLLVNCTLVLGFSIRQAVQLAMQARSHRQLERERARIASDLHDDLGAGLTQMTLLGELLLQEKNLSGEGQNRMQKLCDKARNALKSMDEIIWTVNPRRDTLPDFVAFILEYAQEYLATTPVRCRLDVPDNLPAVPLDLPTRRNLLLAFKEAVRNVARHSKATELSLKIQATTKILHVILQDNGKGFNPDSPSARNGLSNMKERLMDIGGRCLIEAAPGQGCQITFMVPLQESKFSSKKWLARTTTRLFRHG